MKKVLSFILVLSMVLGSMGMAFANPAEQTQSAIDAMVELGFVQGDEGGLRLDETIKRSEVAVIATRIAGLEDIALKSNYQGVFTDVTPELWDNPVMNGAINVAAGQGLVKGYPDGTFAPNADVTNAEIITLMVRLAVSAEEVAELDKGAWPAAYITKAAELGILDGTNVDNFGEAATRETVFVLGYNAHGVRAVEGNYIVKALVLENDRVERLNREEVVVEVIKEVQRADFAEQSRKAEGDQFKLDLSDFADAEDLLGKVVDLSFNKADKVVKVEVDNSYDYLTGKVTATRDKLTLNKKNYTVQLDERYEKEDERIFRTYLNNGSKKYVDFARENGGAEYARVTIKNGKVIFIDAYNFDDVMPVKEVTEIRKKDTIVSYDDVRDGNTIETEVKNTRVVLVDGKTFTVGTLEDVEADNVIHTYKEGKTTNYLVLQDEAIEGKLNKVAEDKDGTYVVVDSKEYTIPTVSPKKAVYEFKSNDKFYTLEAGAAYRELDTFRGEEVRVLLALNGELQYVGSKIELNEYVGVATRIVGRDIRVLNPDNKTNDYSANLDTKVEVEGKTTGHSGLNEITRNSLVYVNVDDKTLVKAVDLDNPVKVNKLTEREINGLRITDETVVYVVNTKGDVEVRTIKDVVKAWDDLTNTDKVTVSLIDEKAFHDISVRGYKFNKDTNVHTMVLYELDIQPKGEDAIYGKLIKYDDRKVGRIDITVELANGARRTFVYEKDKDEDLKLAKDRIYEIVESKEKEDVALSVKLVEGYKTGVVKSIENGLYTFKDNNDRVYETRKTEIFGNRPRINEEIAYTVDKYDDMEIIVNPSHLVKEDTKKDVVTYINTAGTRMEVNGKIYTINEDTRLYNAKGNLIAVGNKDIVLEIKEGKTKVAKIDTDRNDLVLRFELAKVEEGGTTPPPADKEVTIVDVDVTEFFAGSNIVVIKFNVAEGSEATKVVVNGTTFGKVTATDSDYQFEGIVEGVAKTATITVDGKDFTVGL